VGGVGRYTYRLAEEMRHLVDLTVLTTDGAKPLDGVKIVQTRAPRTRFDRFYSTPWRLRALAGSISADVVHSHGDDWALSSNTPIVRSFYGTSWSEAMASSGLRRLNHFVLAGLEKLSARKAVTSLAIAPESLSFFNCDRVIAPVVGLPVKTCIARSEHPRVVFIGSFHGRKRGWLVQQAVENMREALRSSVELYVIGPSSDKESWNPSVIHMAGLTDSEVSEVIGSAWVLLAPSTYEGFGIPTVEALNLNIPVVATSNPGNHYFKSISDIHLPLICVENDDEFISRSVDIVRNGAVLTDQQLESAARFVGYIKENASPAALVDVYRGAINRA
jgi:glycosyltransferase involved in cell wall biosynthesis